MGYISIFGHELIIGNWVEFTSCGQTIIGEIIEYLDNEKLLIKPLGWRGPEDFRNKIKKQYKIKADKLYLLKHKNN